MTSTSYNTSPAKAWIVTGPTSGIGYRTARVSMFEVACMDVRSPLPAPGVADQVKRRKRPRELPIKKAVPSERLWGARKPTATAGLRSTAEDIVQQLPDSAGPLERQGVVDALPLRLLAHRDNRRGDNRVVQKPPQSEAGGRDSLGLSNAVELP
jgi:hypothetical protein